MAKAMPRRSSVPLWETLIAPLAAEQNIHSGATSTTGTTDHEHAQIGGSARGY
jgi:hypothetical protein